MIRRYISPKPSKGTVIPPEVRRAVLGRDGSCVGRKIGMPQHWCSGRAELDHVRASGGLGMKSPSTADNIVLLCSWHHRIKTENGKKWRPLLLAYIESRT